MSSRPSWQDRLFFCVKCDYHWGGWIPINVPIAVAVAVMKKVRCPHCGASSRHVAFDLKAERDAAET